MTKLESRYYYFTGEDKRQCNRKWGKINFKYHFKSDYYDGVGNTLYNFLHTIRKRKNDVKAKGLHETFEIYEFGKLIKKIEITY